MSGTVRRGYLDGPAGQVHYRTAGTGDPVLFLHQSPLSSSQFLAVMDRFAARGFQALAIDMPGFGMSDAAPEPATLANYAAAAHAALDHFGWRRANVVGHHTGAVIGGLLAAEHPERVARLVLNGFPLLTEAEREHFRSFYFGPPEPKADGSHLLQAWNNRLRSTPGWTDLALMHRYTVEALVSGATNWKAFPLIAEADLRGLLAAIRVPTLLLTNTGEDIYEATRRSHELRPDFSFAELAGGTHDIVDEQPDAWTEVVARYLRAG